MTDQVLTGGAEQLLSQGLLGVIVVFLLWYCSRLQTEIKDLRVAHSLEIAAERKLNAELQESRLEESKALVEIVSSNRAAIQALLSVTQQGKAS